MKPFKFSSSYGHRLKIRSNGSNTEVWLDDVQIAAISLTLDLAAGDLPRCSITFAASEVDIDAESLVALQAIASGGDSEAIGRSIAGHLDRYQRTQP